MSGIERYLASVEKQIRKDCAELRQIALNNPAIQPLLAALFTAPSWTIKKTFGWRKPNGFSVDPGDLHAYLRFLVEFLDSFEVENYEIYDTSYVGVSDFKTITPEQFLQVLAQHQTSKGEKEEQAIRIDLAKEFGFLENASGVCQA